MSVFIGVSGSTKAVPTLYIGTPSGNRTVTAGFIGTSGGNKQFYSSASPPPPPPPPPGAPLYTSINPTFTNATASYNAAGGYYEYSFTGTATGGVGGLTTEWSVPSGYTVISQSYSSLTVGVRADVRGTFSGNIVYYATDDYSDHSSASAPISVTVS